MQARRNDEDKNEKPIKMKRKKQQRKLNESKNKFFQKRPIKQMNL